MTFIFDMKKSYSISKDLREICTNIYEICKNENQYIPQLFFGENEALSVSCDDSESVLCNGSTPGSSSPVSYDDSNRVNPLPVLYYGVHEGKTVGFLSADFYNNEIVDICGYVLPKYRKLNLMSSLLDSFLTDYNDFYISAMLNSKNSTGCAVLSHLGFEKTATEYMMKFSLSSACYKTLPKYVKIVDGNLESTTQSVKFEMVSQGATVGSCLIELFNDRTVCIHDVLVFDKYRGMGYGFKMLDAVISYLSKDHTYVLLHVSGDNKPAISLYKKLGFVVVDSAEIYEM